MSTYDLVFETESGTRISCMLVRPQAGQRTSPARTVGRLNPEGSGREDRIYDDLSGGMGYSRRYLPNGYAYGLNVDTRQPKLIMPAGQVTDVTPLLPAGLGEILDQFEYAGHLWMLAGQYALKIDSASGTAFTIANDFGAGVTGVSAQALNGTYYIGRGGNGGYTSFDGTTWTNSAALTRTYQGKSYWETADGSADDRMIASINPTQIKYITRGLDPMVDGNWIGPVTVGDGTHAITKVVSAPRHSYVYTTKSVHDLDNRQRTPPLTSALQYDDNNGAFGLVYDSMALYSAAAGLEGVPLDGSLNQKPNPLHPGVALQVPNETPVYGRTVGLAIEPGTGWATEAVYNGTDTYLRWGRPRSETGVQGLSPWVWHGAFLKLSGERGTHLGYAVDRSTRQTKLWVASMAGSTLKLRWVSVPKASTAYQDYLNGGLHRYATEWSLYFSVDDFGDPGARKVIERYTLSGEQMTDGASIAVSTRVPGVDYTRQGSLTRGDGDLYEGRTSFIATGALRSGYQIGFLVEGRNTSLRPSVMRELTARARLSIERSTLLEFRIAGGDGISLGNRTYSKGNPELLFSRLKGIAGKTPVTLTYRGRRYRVAVDADLAWEEEQAPATGERWGRAIVLRATILSQGIRYNSSESYNASGSYE